jgi:membrane protease YdiL (CAAX protease family)
MLKHDLRTPDRRTALAQSGASYWVQSRWPVTSLAFTAPLLVLYEVGVLVLRQDAFRNGADVWMRRRLDHLGFGQYFLLPLLTVCLLLGWQYISRQPWRFSPSVLYGMAGECGLLAGGLWLLLWLEGLVAGSLRLSLRGSLGTVVAYLGAGIYEELLFRVILLVSAIGLLRWLRAGPWASMLGGILVTSLLFAAAHHVYGEPFVWFSFVFRTLAGGFFAVLFLYRGFGIAAGTHAGYDVLIALTSAAAGRC